MLKVPFTPRWSVQAVKQDYAATIQHPIATACGLAVGSKSAMSEHRPKPVVRGTGVTENLCSRGAAGEAIYPTRRFSERTVVDYFDSAVRNGSVFGLLGQNGVSKSTTIKMLTTPFWPTFGMAQVAEPDSCSNFLDTRRSTKVLLFRARAAVLACTHSFRLSRWHLLPRMQVVVGKVKVQ